MWQRLAQCSNLKQHQIFILQRSFMKVQNVAESLISIYILLSIKELILEETSPMYKNVAKPLTGSQKITKFTRKSRKKNIVGKNCTNAECDKAFVSLLKILRNPTNIVSGERHWCRCTYFRK